MKPVLRVEITRKSDADFVGILEYGSDVFGREQAGMAVVMARSAVPESGAFIQKLNAMAVGKRVMRVFEAVEVRAVSGRGDSR